MKPLILLIEDDPQYILVLKFLFRALSKLAFKEEEPKFLEVASFAGTAMALTYEKPHIICLSSKKIEVPEIKTLINHYTKKDNIVFCFFSESSLLISDAKNKGVSLSFLRKDITEIPTFSEIFRKIDITFLDF